MRPVYLTIAISNLNFNFPPLIVHRYQQVVLKFRQRVLYPYTPPSGKNTCVLDASTLIYLTVILVSTFQLLYSRYQGGPKFAVGGPTPPGRHLAEKFFFYIQRVLHNIQQFPRFQWVPYLSQAELCPLYAPQLKIFCTRGEYVTMSNGVFNFNFLALLLSEILGGSQIYTRRPYAPWTPPSGEFFFTQSEYFTISNCVFNFNILAVVVSKLIGGPKFTLGGSVPPCTTLGEKFLYPRRVLYYV